MIQLLLLGSKQLQNTPDTRTNKSVVYIYIYLFCMRNESFIGNYDINIHSNNIFYDTSCFTHFKNKCDVFSKN